MSVFRIKTKVFCIGCNKTGTTSLGKALDDLGYVVGDVGKAQGLIKNYAQRDFKSIIKFCKKVDAVQDAPFSWHYSFIHLDQAFPTAKFILSVRDSDEQWYQSLVKFHSKLFGENGSIPTAEQLKNSFRPQGRNVWENWIEKFDVTEEDPYNRDILIDYYTSHNKMVIDYFKNRDNLIIINLSDEDSYRQFCEFLGKDALYDRFPWENKTSSIRNK